MSRLLNDLSPLFKSQACELVARCVEAGVMVMIIGTGRTLQEQEANVARGVSWTMKSKHLIGEAIDLCPYDIYLLGDKKDKLQWDAADPVWLKIGRIGEALGLKWGGRWVQQDLSHFETPTHPTGASPRVETRLV